MRGGPSWPKKTDGEGSGRSTIGDKAKHRKGMCNQVGGKVANKPIGVNNGDREPGEGVAADCPNMEVSELTQWRVKTRSSRSLAIVCNTRIITLIWWKAFVRTSRTLSLEGNVPRTQPLAERQVESSEEIRMKTTLNLPCLSSEDTNLVSKCETPLRWRKMKGLRDPVEPSTHPRRSVRLREKSSQGRKDLFAGRFVICLYLMGILVIASRLEFRIQRGTNYVMGSRKTDGVSLP
ncbi:hypothetical protein ACSQ67_026249 [Phaseolus vulgaris]